MATTWLINTKNDNEKALQVPLSEYEGQLPNHLVHITLPDRVPKILEEGLVTNAPVGKGSIMNQGICLYVYTNPMGPYPDADINDVVILVDSNHVVANMEIYRDPMNPSRRNSIFVTQPISHTALVMFREVKVDVYIDIYRRTPYEP